MTIKYEYNKGDLLKNPQQYNFTEYHGWNFLIEYKKSRNKISMNNIFKLEEFEKSLENLISEINSDHIKNKNIKTEKLLKILLKNIIQKNYFDYKQIDIFIKKFEVKKKIFDEYDENYIAISENFSNLINYILLSGICLIIYKKERNLKYLNTALKLNDILTNKILNKNNKLFLYLQELIKIELYFIENLIKEKIKIE